ncbi:MAG TPA: O-antigen ligase family protein [Tepidisphaeraceae bacterium]|jgi:hypothetical protein
MGSVAAQFILALQFLASPMGLLAMAAFLLLAVLALLIPQFKWPLLSMMIVASTFSLDTLTSGRLVFPLEQMRLQGRPLTLGLMLLLLLALLRVPQGKRHKYVLPATVAFFIFELMASMRMVFGNLFARGASELIIFMFIFLTLGLALARAIRNWDDGVMLVRSLAGAGAIFAVINVMQFIARPSSVLRGGRFMGTTGNPQHAAEYCAALMLPVLYLLVRPGKTRLMRGALAGIFAVLLVMLLWTASRTGALMAATGIVLLFRHRVGRLLGAGILVGILVLIVLNFTSSESSSQIEYSRLISTQDTRSYVWSGLLRQFAENPIMGILPNSEIELGESSYLSVAARFGLIGLVPLLIAMWMTVPSLLKLQRVKRSFPDPMLADFVLAAFGQIFIGAFCEGYLASILQVMIFIIYCCYTLAAFLLEYAELPALEEETIDQYFPETNVAITGAF